MASLGIHDVTASPIGCFPPYPEGCDAPEGGQGSSDLSSVSGARSRVQIDRGSGLRA